MNGVLSLLICSIMRMLGPLVLDGLGGRESFVVLTLFVKIKTFTSLSFDTVTVHNLIRSVKS